LKSSGQSQLRERTDTFCARGILLTVLFILAWSPLAYGGMDPYAFLVIQGAIVLALVLWMVRLWVQRPFRLLWPPLCWAVLAFLLYALVRCRLVPVEYAGRQELIQVLLYGTLFLVVLNNLNRKNSATWVSVTLIAVGFVVAMFAIYQFATHSQMIWGFKRTFPQYAGRGSGTFIDPDHLACFLGMTVPLALSFTVVSRFSATIKVLLAYSAVTMLAGIVVSLSRGGILATVIGLVLFCVLLLAQRDFWKSALVMLCVLAALGMFALSQFESVQKRFDEVLRNDKVSDGRQYYWAAAWQLTKRDPVWGVGPGHFDVEFPALRPWEVQSRPQFVHNEYLDTLCEWGAVGLSIVAAGSALLLWGVSQVWRTFRKSSNEMGSRFSDRTAFVVGGTVGVVVLMLHCTVEFNMHIAALAVTAVTLIALLAAQTRFATEQYWKNPGRIGKTLLTMVAAAAVGYLSMQGLHKGMEVYWLGRARAAQNQPEKVIVFATKAIEAEPTDWEANYKMGDYLWSLSLLDGADYLDRAKQAMAWYAKAMQLDPFDAYAPVACGKCLDRIGGSPEEATRYFVKALQNDPRNTYVAMELGRHCIELGELAAARRWMVDGGLRWSSESTDLDVGEIQQLDRLMADPLYTVAADMIRTNKSPMLQREIAPLLKGPK
jgi:O-antigen ligase